MGTESDAKGSFQDFVDTALSLSSSTGASVASECACSFAASLGRQETRPIALSSCSSDRTLFSASSSLVQQTESSLNKTFLSEDLAAKRQSHTPIPTKKFSSPEFEPDSSALCLYSSCQRDQTTLSSSTSCRSKLKPGDYLPPLYIDTQNYGVANFRDTSLLFQEVPSEKQTLNIASERNLNAMDIVNQHFDISVGVTSLSTCTTTTATATSMCNDSSCVLTPLSLSDLSQNDKQKSLEQQEEEIEELSESCFMETPSSQFDDSVDDLDLESVSDFKKYLNEVKLDLRTLDNPLSEHSSLSSTDCLAHLKSNCDCQTKNHQSLPHMWTQEKETDTMSISGLRLSILDDFSSKHDLISWLDACAFGEASTPPLSPELSPGWREIADVQLEPVRNSKHETNILEFFSDDNAHAFLSDDSAINQMHISQFV